MILKSSIMIHATPEMIFQFFDDMVRNYRRWHPDHVSFQWLSGRGIEAGNVAYFGEKIGGKLLKKKVAYTQVIRGQHLEFAPSARLFRLFLPRMLFRIERERRGSVLIHANKRVRLTSRR